VKDDEKEKVRTAATDAIPGRIFSPSLMATNRLSSHSTLFFHRLLPPLPIFLHLSQNFPAWFVLVVQLRPLSLFSNTPSLLFLPPPDLHLSSRRLPISSSYAFDRSSDSIKEENGFLDDLFVLRSHSLSAQYASMSSHVCSPSRPRTTTLPIRTIRRDLRRFELSRLAFQGSGTDG